jgi:hypothetical protein
MKKAPTSPPSRFSSSPSGERRSEKGSAPPVGRKHGPARQWDENMLARFKAGTAARIAAVLREGETRVAFVNAAVVREIERRERRK